MATYREIDLKDIHFAFHSLGVFRGLLSDPVLTALYDLVEYLEGRKIECEAFLDRYNRCYHTILQAAAPTLYDHMIDLILYQENPFSKSFDPSYRGIPPEALFTAVADDLRRLQLIAGIGGDRLKGAASRRLGEWGESNSLITSLPEWPVTPHSPAADGAEAATGLPSQLRQSREWAGLVDQLADFYRQHGSGKFARYRAFTWEDHRLVGVASPDPVRLSDLIGYEKERQEIMENTRQFLEGYPANNVLLYGDRGTGKSSTVKALVNEFWPEGLRIVEIPKANLIDFPEVIRELRGKAQKFIIFIDDLAFADSEESYTAMKAVLEGGLESRPDNVLIYATSNRRHLIKERFSDRSGLQSEEEDDQIRAADTIQEKLSLADRFGITVVFSAPDQEQFLSIVSGIAAQRGLSIEPDQLKRAALRWVCWHNGLSPRTAHQFLNWLEGHLGLSEGKVIDK